MLEYYLYPALVPFKSFLKFRIDLSNFLNENDRSQNKKYFSHLKFGQRLFLSVNSLEVRVKSKFKASREYQMQNFEFQPFLMFDAV